MYKNDYMSVNQYKYLYKININLFSYKLRCNLNKVDLSYGGQRGR